LRAEQQIKKLSRSSERSALHRLGDAQPSIDPSAWIAPTAAVIGDVRIGAESCVWFHWAVFEESRVKLSDALMKSGPPATRYSV
jgi:hypothetical protein